MFSAKDLFFTPSSGGYTVNNSLRFRSSASAYLSRTPAVAGNLRVWTWSGWVKRGALGGTQALFTARSASNPLFLFEITSDQLTIFARNSGGTTIANYTSNAVFRDPSAWYHIVLTWNATASSMAIYVNSVSQALTTATAISNVDYAVNSTIVHEIARHAFSTTDYLDGYLAEVNFIDGQALTPSSFGQTDATTGVWQPKAYTGTYGTNGFYLKFSDIALTSGSNAGLGKDFSGNTNYWNTNGISVSTDVTYDAMVDSPTNSAAASNYATLNPLLDWHTNGSNFTFSNGNLDLSEPAATTYGSAASTIAMTTGKWYCEITPTTVGAAQYTFVGLTATTSAAGYPGQTATSYSYGASGNKYNNNAGATYGATFASNDIIGVAFDAGNGKLWFSKNGTWQASGDPAAGTNAAFTSISAGAYYFVVGDFASSQSSAFSCNFGQRPFAYTPPSGFVALNTQNLPTPTIAAGANNMAAVLYNGTSASNTVTATSSNSGNNPLAITFQPDLVWIKSRSAATNHELTDSVRGVTKSLNSNTTAAEATDTNGLTAFTSSGFTVGSDSNYNNGTGPATYVAWEWKAGGSSSSNTSGTITSTVSANVSAGFSVVTWTCPTSGAYTVGHGLGVMPSMIIMKDRSVAGTAWITYHASATTTTGQYLVLNSTAVTASAAGIWGSALPTSTVFGNTPNVGVTASSLTVAYCFAPVAGYSAFGSYVGNSLGADGPFVYTGFRPKFILIKSSTLAGTNWIMFDTSRDTYNVSGAKLAANTSDLENSGATGIAGGIDILSNGFKTRLNWSELNSNGNTFIYAAFAENPFSIARAR